MPKPRRLVFLPGARGDASFWQPASELLTGFESTDLLGWPWSEAGRANSRAASIEGLADNVAERLDGPSALIAQSLGGAVALLATLKLPESVTHLVLTATSGGIPIWDLGIIVPRWIADQHVDLSRQLRHVDVPTLLLWGDVDPISPVAVGRRLEALLPQAELHVVPGGDHDLGKVHASRVASAIERHLNRT
jgi:pimeloyl-ACP methyl ester carboxylesterase